MNIEITNKYNEVINSYILQDNIDLTTKGTICGANIYNTEDSYYSIRY